MKLRKCFKQNVYVLIKMLSKEFMYKKANWKSINEKSTAYVSTVKDCCHSAISESNKHLGNKVINQELKKEYKRLVLTQLNNETGNTKEYLKLLHTTKCNNSDLENNTTKYVDAFMKEVKNSYKNLQVLSSQNIIIDSSSKNYILEDSDQIYMSMKQKFDKNINALTLIKDIESRNHNATEEEQKILVQYSGFGGLSIIFNENDEKGRPKDRETLKSIVTKEEYK